MHADSAVSETQNWAVITGAGSGIGAALARELAARNVSVMLVGRREALLSEMSAMIAGQVPVLVVQADIAKDKDRKNLYRTVSKTLQEQGGRLKYLVNNAGIGLPSPNFRGMDAGELEHAFAVNVTAPLALNQLFLPALKSAAPARIMLVGAGIADRPQPGTGIYGITKKALARLYDQILTDFAHENEADMPEITLFQPGMVDTEGLRAHVETAHDCGLPHADYIAAALAEGNARRPEDVAKVMANALLEFSSADYHGQTLRS